MSIDVQKILGVYSFELLFYFPIVKIRSCIIQYTWYDYYPKVVADIKVGDLIHHFDSIQCKWYFTKVLKNRPVFLTSIMNNLEYIINSHTINISIYNYIPLWHHDYDQNTTRNIFNTIIRYPLFEGQEVFLKVFGKNVPNRMAHIANISHYSTDFQWMRAKIKNINYVSYPYQMCSFIIDNTDNKYPGYNELNPILVEKKLCDRFWKNEDAHININFDSNSKYKYTCECWCIQCNIIYCSGFFEKRIVYNETLDLEVEDMYNFLDICQNLFEPILDRKIIPARFDNFYSIGMFDNATLPLPLPIEKKENKMISPLFKGMDMHQALAIYSHELLFHLESFDIRKCIIQYALYNQLPVKANKIKVGDITYHYEANEYKWYIVEINKVEKVIHPYQYENIKIKYRIGSKLYTYTMQENDCLRYPYNQLREKEMAMIMIKCPLFQGQVVYLKVLNNGNNNQWQWRYAKISKVLYCYFDCLQVDFIILDAHSEYDVRQVIKMHDSNIFLKKFTKLLTDRYRNGKDNCTLDEKLGCSCIQCNLQICRYAFVKTLPSKFINGDVNDVNSENHGIILNHKKLHLTI